MQESPAKKTNPPSSRMAAQPNNGRLSNGNRPSILGRVNPGRR